MEIKKDLLLAPSIGEGLSRDSWTSPSGVIVSYATVEIPTAHGTYRPRLRTQGSDTLAIFSPSLTVDALRAHSLRCAHKNGTSVALASGMDVMLLDLLGYGESDPNPEASGGQYMRADLMEDLDEIMRWIRARYKRVVFLSYSIHSLAWSRWAVHNADITLGVVYLSPNQTATTISPRQRAAYERLLEELLLHPKGRTASHESLAKRIKSSEAGHEFLHEDFWKEIERVGQDVTSFRENGTWHAVSQLHINMVKDILESKEMDAYLSHTFPTLMFRGEFELDTPVEMTTLAYSQVPHPEKKMVVVPQTSHFYIWEQNQIRYLDEMQDFFARIAG